MGSPPRGPDESFHRYMSRLYALQGQSRGKSPQVITRLPAALKQFWLFLKAPQLELEHRHPMRNHHSFKERTMLNITAVGRLGKDPELHHTVRSRDHRLLPGRHRSMPAKSKRSG